MSFLMLRISLVLVIIFGRSFGRGRNAWISKFEPFSVITMKVKKIVKFANRHLKMANQIIFLLESNTIRIRFWFYSFYLFLLGLPFLSFKYSK